ncbi:MAG: hypothetical protein ABW252_02555 [Polyangiales bacterium]
MNARTTGLTLWVRGGLLACLLLGRAPAHAEAPAEVEGAPSDARPPAASLPADVVNSDRASLAALPSDFVEKRIGEVTWAYHPRDADLVRDLWGKFPSAFRKVRNELGQPVSEKMTIRIARGPEDMRRLAPIGSPPPSYAVGVAYPALGLIILSVVSPESWFPPDLTAVMTHEISHVALHRAVRGNPVPLWFAEGLATQQASEHRLARVRTLWEAAVSGDVLPLDEVSRSFPDRPHAVNLAYAQSADFVRHMLQSTSDRQRLPRLLAKVAEGASFEQAVLVAYRMDLAYLERDWRQGLGERFRLLPLVLTGTALWAGIALLVIVAFARRRRDQREKLARWEREEAEADSAAMAALQHAGDLAPPSDAPRVLHVYALPAALHEAGVPTIEHEGQRHTLH